MQKFSQVVRGSLSDKEIGGDAIPEMFFCFR
jgi:hypothetical protein